MQLQCALMGNDRTARPHDEPARAYLLMARARVAPEIVESYAQLAQEDLGASWAARQSMREEPWDRPR